MPMSEDGGKGHAGEGVDYFIEVKSAVGVRQLGAPGFADAHDDVGADCLVVP